MDRFDRRWPELERSGLMVVGGLAMVVGLAWIAIGLNPSPEARVAGDFRPFGVALGVATLVAGGLAALRRREDLVVSILGSLTGATFAVAVALTTLPETTWNVFSATTIFAALLLGVLAFRGAFRGR